MDDWPDDRTSKTCRFSDQGLRYYQLELELPHFGEEIVRKDDETNRVVGTQADRADVIIYYEVTSWLRGQSHKRRASCYDSRRDHLCKQNKGDRLDQSEPRRAPGAVTYGAPAHGAGGRVAGDSFTRRNGAY